MPDTETVGPPSPSLRRVAGHETGFWPRAAQRFGCNCHRCRPVTGGGEISFVCFPEPFGRALGVLCRGSDTSTNSRDQTRLGHLPRRRHGTPMLNRCRAMGSQGAGEGGRGGEHRGGGAQTKKIIKLRRGGGYTPPTWRWGFAGSHRHRWS